MVTHSTPGTIIRLSGMRNSKAKLKISKDSTAKTAMLVKTSLVRSSIRKSFHNTAQTTWK